MTTTTSRLVTALADRDRIERGLFLAPPRGMAEFDRIIAKAARRVAGSSA